MIGPHARLVMRDSPTAWMSNSLSTPHVARRRDAWLVPLSPTPPPWVDALIAAEGIDTAAPRYRRVTGEVPDVSRLGAAQLEAAVAEVYGSIARTLHETAHHPIRFWNFVPAIHGDMGDGRDRYMVFNAGRFTAFRHWFGSSAVFNRTLPTASAVGTSGAALVVHCLAADAPGTPVENPRQIPAYAYSQRYGPLPPCFARGTIVEGRGKRLLFVGGTASIVGERSQHERDVRKQVAETLHNLTCLIGASRGDDPHTLTAGALDTLRHVRVYLVRAKDADVVRDLVQAAMPSMRTLEFAQADLCRRELLVEIEGCAEL